jgi:hypothetical protein
MYKKKKKWSILNSTPRKNRENKDFFQTKNIWENSLQFRRTELQETVNGRCADRQKQYQNEAWFNTKK